MVKKRVTLRP